MKLTPSRLAACKAHLSNLAKFIMNNIRRILLSVVLAFFIFQIIAGALAALNGKLQPPYKRYGFSAGPLKPSPNHEIFRTKVKSVPPRGEC
jgi:hypothetical protein